MLKNKSFYIPNLNGLRFFAAFAVILGHIELSKDWLHLPNFYHIPFFQNCGHLGVLFFFVLSGYLITSLLIKEKEKTNTINYKWFIIRRVLRIWPVYFLLIIVVIFGIHGYNSFKEKQKIICFLLVAPNVSAAFFGGIKYISHLWTIGVEEQFYLLWPGLMKFLGHKGVIISLILISVCLPIAPNLLDYLSIRNPINQDLFNGIKSFLNYFQIQCMAVGGILAYINHFKPEALKFLKNKLALYLTCLICLTSVIFPFHIAFYNSILYSIIFGLMIYAMANTKKTFLENNVFNYLGQISYGIYCYHWLVVYSVIELNPTLAGGKTITSILYTYGLSLIITIIISVISFNFFETKILKFKTRFAIIKSGKA